MSSFSYDINFPKINVNGLTTELKRGQEKSEDENADDTMIRHFVCLVSSHVSIPFDIAHALYLKISGNILCSFIQI